MSESRSDAAAMWARYGADALAFAEQLRNKATDDDWNVDAPAEVLIAAADALDASLRLGETGPKYAVVEIRGEAASRVGRVSEVTWLGVPALCVDDLCRDGSVHEYVYPRDAIWSVRYMSEQAARMTANIRFLWDRPCREYVAGALLESRCRVCGWAAFDHH